MALLDTYKAVIHADYLGKDCQNRFYYRQTAGTSLLAGGLNAALVDDLIPIMASLQSEDLVYDRIEIINMDNPADFGIFPVPGPITGARVGTTAPSFNAWAFRLNRTTRNIRNGRKSLAGVMEGDTTGNDPHPDFLPVLNAAGIIFGATIVNTAGDAYAPLLAREVLGVITYSEPVSSAQFVRYSTQNSRK